MKFQGRRPFAFGDVWDRMTTSQRRFAFYSDLVVGIVGAIAFGFFAHLMGG